MLGGPAPTRPLGRRAGAAVSDSDDAAGELEAAIGVVSTLGWRGIRTETTAAMTAENVPPITTR